MKKLIQLVWGLAALAALLLSPGAQPRPGSAQSPTQPEPVVVDGAVVGPDRPAAVAAIEPPLMGTGVLHIGPEAFQPFNPATTFARFQLLLRPTGAANTYHFDAPVNLPHGVRVKQVVLYALDNDATYNATVSLMSTPYNLEVGGAEGTASTSGAYGLIRHAAITSFVEPHIDLTANSYFVRVSLVGSANVYLKSVRIDYSYDTALPVISKQ